MFKINSLYFLAFIRYLTFKRFTNYLKLKLSYWFSTTFNTYFHCGYPFAVSVEPASFCNLQCKECSIGNRQNIADRKFMNFEIFEKIVSEMSDYVLYMNLYFQGEPFLAPNLCNMIGLANRKKIFTSTSTNGHFLTDKMCENIVSAGLKELIISIDGVTQNVYEKYRVGGNLKTVLQGIENIQRAKTIYKSEYPIVVMQFLVSAVNEHQISEIKKLAKTLNINKLQLKSMQINNFGANSFLIPTIKKYSRYKKDCNGKYSIKNKLQNRCFRLWSSAVINAKGEIVPCCFDKLSQFVMGNISNQLFGDIWKNSKFKNFRKQIFKNRKAIEICCNCIE